MAKDYSYTLLEGRDLRDFAGLSTCVVTQRQKILLTVGWELVRWHLEGMYGNIDEGVDNDGNLTFRVSYPYGDLHALTLHQVMGVVDVKKTGEQEMTLEWDSSAANDMIADSTLAVLTHIDRSPASAKRRPSSSSIYV